MKPRALVHSNKYFFPFLPHSKEANLHFLIDYSPKLPFKASVRTDSLHICRSAITENTKEKPTFSDLENQLIEAIVGIQGRGKSASPRQLSEVAQAVKCLESSEGVPEPTKSPLIEGRWQLMFTTRPGTASPIQRTFTGVDSFAVFQEVLLQTTDPRVSNIVRFSEAIGELKVEAAASPVSGTRINFRFDKAAFSLKFLPFKVPYPVPFRLLGDEAKGWLETTYLSPNGNLRISKGNKGTTFVLQKNVGPRQKLLSVISSGEREAILEVIEDFLSTTGEEEKPLELVDGEWQMIWSSQMVTESWMENAANGLMGKQIVSKNGTLKFVVDMLLGFKYTVFGSFERRGERLYDVLMKDAAIVAGPFGFPVEMKPNSIVFELLYFDEKIRISRGYNDIVFVHVRVFP